jgi:glycosyltransferase involved in cell wall biosynthesis
VRAAPLLEENIMIVMMGRGFGSTQSELNELIVREGVADRVKILPPVPYDELLDWTSSADIGLTLLPPDYSLSIEKCLPNKFFEYLMAGLPVLTSRLDAIVEVIETYAVGRVIPSLSPQDISAAINSVLNDQESLERMRTNALEIAQARFCWEKESQELIRLYQKILAKQNRPSPLSETASSQQAIELLPVAKKETVS